MFWSMSSQSVAYLDLLGLIVHLKFPIGVATWIILHFLDWILFLLDNVDSAAFVL